MSRLWSKRSQESSQRRNKEDIKERIKKQRDTESQFNKKSDKKKS